MAAPNDRSQGLRARDVLLRKARIGLVFGGLDILQIIVLLDGGHCGPLRGMFALLIVTYVYYGVPLVIVLLAGAILTMILPDRVIARYGWFTIALTGITVLATLLTLNVQSADCSFAL
jgi:hypothetical protein